MAVDLKVTLGTVNYTDWLHVTASKVSTPSIVAWETWIDVPVTNYNFVIPNLDPANYYVRYYDAATNGSLGTLVAELIVNALTGDTLFERRFYVVGGPRPFDPIVGGTIINDPYLVGKNVTGMFKEGHRFLDPTDEYTFDGGIGEFEVINGTSWSIGERIALEIKYNVGNSTVGTSVGLYTGYLDVPETTKNLAVDEINARLRLLGTGPKQTLNLPDLATIAVDNGYYFDNSIGGTAVQPKIIPFGSQRIRFNGFMASTDLLDEFWCSKGEHVLLRKYNDSYWEVVTDYKGTNVGERFPAGTANHPNCLPEALQKIDGDEYGRLYWWVKNVLPATHKYIDDQVELDSFTHDASKRGQFALHSTLKIFRMPDTRGLVDKGLTNFLTMGLDGANRPVDYPGGFQAQMLLGHGHSIKSTNSGPAVNSGADVTRGNAVGSPNARGGASSGADDKTIGFSGGPQNRVDNNGVVFLRRI